MEEMGICQKIEKSIDELKEIAKKDVSRSNRDKIKLSIDPLEDIHNQMVSRSVQFRNRCVDVASIPSPLY